MPKLGLYFLFVMNVVAFFAGVASWETFGLILAGMIAWNLLASVGGRFGFVARARYDEQAEALERTLHRLTEMRDSLAQATRIIEHLQENAMDEDDRRALKIEGQNVVFWAFHNDRAQFDLHYRNWQARTGSSQRSDNNQRQARPKQTVDWRNVLGVSQTATYEEVTMAYRKLAKRYHPDNRETGDAANMQRVNAAKDAADRHFGR